MYNLRYHIASLAAVFLALAVGLVLGTVVAERGMLTDQSAALVEDLQRQFDEINKTNSELRAGLERDQTFAEDLVPVVIANALPGQDVMVVAGTGRVDGLGSVQDGVEQAGGVPALATIREAGLGLEQAAPPGLEQYFSDRGETMESPGPELERQVADALVREWARAADRPLTEILTDDGLLRLESMSETATVDAFVVMAAAEDGEGCDSFALALAKAADASGRVAVGAESLSSEDEVARAVAGEGLSAVDHVGTAQGRYSLVWILARRAEGYFGAGNGADAFYPPPE